MKQKPLILWAEIDLRDYETVCEKVSTKFFSKIRLCFAVSERTDQ